MCLIPKSSAKIAKEDMEVYKVLYRCQDENYISPYKGATYNINELKISNIRYRCKYHNVLGFTTTLIEEGLHSYTSKGIALLRAFAINGIVFKAIIPEGVMYVLGDGDEIVSTQLKLIEECH